MDEHRDILDSLTMRLAGDPMLAAEVLKRVVENQGAFIKAVEAQRNCEASQAILDLIAAVVDPKGFAKLPLAQQKNLMHRVIAYHFGRGVDISKYAPCEVEFFKKFGGKK